MTVPKLTVSKEQAEAIRPVEELECLPLEIIHVLLDPDHGSALAIIEAENKKVAYPLNAQEGTQLSFVRAGLSDHAHLQTIYQLYCRLFNTLRFELKRAVIEAKRGDMYYARLVWEDQRGHKVFHSCSVGDAMILAVLTGADLEIVKKVLDAMDPLTDMAYRDQMEFDEE